MLRFVLTHAKRVLALFVHPACLDLVFFIAGAAFSPIRTLPCRPLESSVPQFLGRISYSLYLVHGPIAVFACAHLGPEGPLLCLPIVLAAAWLMWCVVERPSVAWSRGRKMFFSEEKNQKTFKSPPLPNVAAHSLRIGASIFSRAPE